MTDPRTSGVEETKTSTYSSSRTPMVWLSGQSDNYLCCPIPHIIPCFMLLLMLFYVRFDVR